MEVISAWFAALLLKIKIIIIIYCILLAICLVYAIVIYFSSDNVELSSQTFTTNGVYLLESSFFQKFENVLFGNIQAMLSATRKAIVFNDTFRALTILVTVLAVVLMGFTMLIGDQQITIREFFKDIVLIFGSAAILLYYDPTLSVDPNAVMQPEKYITLLYNFLQSISDFISKMLFSTVNGFMNIQYKDGTTVGYYAPIDVIASMFFDPEISYRVKLKIAALILSPMFIFIPLLLIIILRYLVPCVLSVFIAILLAKSTIMFALQFLPFFILFSSINDVNIKINKKAKGMDLSMKLIIEGIAQPMLFLALISFLAGFLFYIFVISNISDVFNFSITNRDALQANYEDCASLEFCMWPFGCVDIPYDLFCIVRNSLRWFFYTTMNSILPPITGPRNLSYQTFFVGLIQLWIGIIIFKKLFAKISPIMVNLVGGSAATNVFTKGGGEGIYDAKNDVGKFVKQNYQDHVDSAIKAGFGYDVNDKLFNDPTEKNEDGSYKSLLNTDAPKSDLSQGVITNPFGLLDKVYKKDDKKEGAVDEAVDGAKKGAEKQALNTGIDAAGKAGGQAADQGLVAGGEALKSNSATIGTAAGSAVAATGVGAVAAPLVGTLATGAAAVGGEAMSKAGELGLGSKAVDVVADKAKSIGGSAIDNQK